MVAITPLRSESKKARRDPLFPALSPLSIVPISLLLLAVATMHAADLFASQPTSLGDAVVNGPFLTILRDQPGQMFAQNRIFDAPYLYGVGHVVPAIAWTLFIPLQHSSALRARYKALHRAAGYLILFSTVVLSLTGASFKFYNLAFFHDNTFHLHRPWKNTLPWIVIPNAQIGILALSGWTLFTVYKTLSAARRRDFQAHKFWASLLTLAGLSIHFERWTFGAINLVGRVCSWLPVEVQGFLAIPRQRVDFVPGEMAAFSLSIWLGMTLAGLWSYELWTFMSPKGRQKVG